MALSSLPISGIPLNEVPVRMSRLDSEHELFLALADARVTALLALGQAPPIPPTPRGRGEAGESSPRARFLCTRSHVHQANIKVGARAAPLLA